MLSLAYQEQVNCKLDWISNISNIITNNNNIANTQYAHNTDYLRRNANNLEPYQIKNVMSNLINNFDRHWEYSKSTSPKLLFYHQVKTKFNREPYLNDVKRFTDRTALTQLRISAHDLKIETGRYTNQSHEERLCDWCQLVTSSINVENEKHALLECDLYNTHIRDFITFARTAVDTVSMNLQGVSTSYDDIELFIPKDKNPRYNCRLSNTISNIFKTRKKFIDTIKSANTQLIQTIQPTA